MKLTRIRTGGLSAINNGCWAITGLLNHRGVRQVSVVSMSFVEDFLWSFWYYCRCNTITVVGDAIIVHVLRTHYIFTSILYNIYVCNIFGPLRVPFCHGNCYYILFRSVQRPKYDDEWYSSRYRIFLSSFSSSTRLIFFFHSLRFFFFGIFWRHDLLRVRLVKIWRKKKNYNRRRRRGCFRRPQTRRNITD